MDRKPPQPVRAITRTRLGWIRKLGESTTLLTVRTVVLVSLVYATWHFGAVGSDALHRLCWLAVVGLTAALLYAASSSGRLLRIPVPLFVLILVWIGYALLQSAPLPTPLTPWFARSVSQATRFTEHQNELAVAAAALRQTSSPDAAGLVPSRTGSSIPEATRTAVIPYILALAIAVLTTIGFQDDRPRLVLLWTVILNAAALAVWGIVQRAGGGREILPGIEYTWGGNPFGSFIYKNAGAAALLPGIVSLVAVLLLRSRNSTGSSGVSYSAARRPHDWNSQFKSLTSLWCVFLGGILFAGLLASLSRGAWLAGLLSMATLGVIVGISLRDRRTWIGSAVVMGMLVAVTTVAGLTNNVRSRAEQVSIEHISADPRWGQWADGFRTAIANFPSGSGLGTYAFSTLSFQSEPRPTWFQDAHNQYLETLVETGIVGIGLVIAGMMWFGRHSHRLLRSSDFSVRGVGVRSTWGLVGIAILMCGGIQSVFDFVLKIPANLILYSMLVAAVAVTRQQSVRHEGRSFATPGVDVNNGQVSGTQIRRGLVVAGSRMAWVAMALCGAIFGLQYTDHQIKGDAAVVSSRQLERDTDLSESRLTAERLRLDEAIAVQPGRGELYLDRAWLAQSDYRRRLVETASRKDVKLERESSQISTIAGLLLSVPVDQRQQLREDLLSDPELQTSLANLVSDLRLALLRNPYHPQTHFRSALLAPLAGYEIEPWLSNSVKLANNHHNILFLNGLLALFKDDSATMVDQWSKAILIDDTHTDEILELAPRKVSLYTVIQHLVPDDRPDRINELVGRHRESLLFPCDDEEVERIITMVGQSERFELGQRYAVCAGLYAMLDQNQKSVDNWELAVRARPFDPTMRLGFTQALDAADFDEEALDQALLGGRLFPTDRRFKKLASSIRLQISSRRAPSARAHDDTNVR